MNKQLEGRTEKEIKECIWYKSETMLAQTSSPCNTCGGYRRECAESGKYFPRGEDEMKSFVEHFKQNWARKYDRDHRVKRR